MHGAIEQGLGTRAGISRRRPTAGAVEFVDRSGGRLVPGPLIRCRTVRTSGVVTALTVPSPVRFRTGTAPILLCHRTSDVLDPACTPTA
jgi:hypothetical protein